MASKGMIFCRM